jgi:hypothetical protein
MINRLNSGGSKLTKSKAPTNISGGGVRSVPSVSIEPAKHQSEAPTNGLPRVKTDSRKGTVLRTREGCMGHNERKSMRIKEETKRR